MESHVRSITKALSYRLLGSSLTSLILLMATGKLTVAIAGGIADMVLKIAAYFIHERIWNNIEFGRTKHQDI